MYIRIYLPVHGYIMFILYYQILPYNNGCDGFYAYFKILYSIAKFENQTHKNQTVCNQWTGQPDWIYTRLLSFNKFSGASLFTIIY